MRMRLKAARFATSYPGDLALRNWSQLKLVEAAAPTGDLAAATHALEELAKTTGPSGTEWALGIEALCRALASADDAAEELYGEAITRGSTSTGESRPMTRPRSLTQTIGRSLRSAAALLRSRARSLAFCLSLCGDALCGGEVRR